ncbi:class D sortase [Heyndrickxia vini]|uniref:Class D sortase n=1 Tax=Heyndrickxia vini TaxID=1476025 RepID=A0ABX7E7Y4_9BACI|nr:class D sortase [Heyndrickxia vini]QQZ10947.1 class D sortase [Heyndrickxia vini]
MIKPLSFIIILFGLLFIGIGGYQFFKTQHAQSKSIEKAQQLLKQTNDVKKQTPQQKTDFKPKQNDVVGILSIPQISAELPIVEGTDEDDLEKGVGHYKGTAYPMDNDQIVLSGHRDTVFRKMGELRVGDILTIKLPYGTFSYEIKATKIVDADDRSVIQSTAPNEVLTVTTCYPFSYIGDAPNRYIITALPVQLSPKQ